MNQTRIIIILLIMTTISQIGYAQKKKDPADSKFVYMTSIGFAGGVGDIKLETKSVSNKKFSFQVNQLLAYQFNPLFFMGVGAGIDVWGKSSAFIPLYLNLSVNCMKTRIAPHWYINMGYSFKWYVSAKPELMTGVIHGSTAGLYGESGLGIKVKLNDQVNILVLGTYKLQQSTIKYSIAEPGKVDYSSFTTNRSKMALYHFAGLKISILY